MAVVIDPNSLQPKQLQPDYVSSYKNLAPERRSFSAVVQVQDIGNGIGSRHR